MGKAITSTPARSTADDEVSASPTTAPGRVTLIARTVFHNLAQGASSGVTLQPGDVFETNTVHADELTRAGFAEAHAPAAEPAADA